MKKYKSWAFIIVCIFLMIFCFVFEKGKTVHYESSQIEYQETNYIDEGKETNIELIVYVTDTGYCYHKFGCKYLKSISKKFSVKEAKNNGYRACSYCF